jgi:hypothetical protein
MDGSQVICSRPLATGQSCGLPVTVHEVHYRYDLSPETANRILTEIRYDFVCPRCGWRTQSEPVRHPAEPSVAILPSLDIGEVTTQSAALQS